MGMKRYTNSDEKVENDERKRIEMYQVVDTIVTEMEELQVEDFDPSYSAPGIYDDILAYVKSLVDYNSATLLLVTKKNKRLQPVAEYGEGCNFINGMHFKMGSGLSAWLAQRKRTICLSDIHRGARHGHNPIRSFVAIPILFQDNVIGILNLAHILPNAFGQEEVENLQEMLKTIAPRINSLLSTET
jgi:GAF domain-containing protein